MRPMRRLPRRGQDDVNTDTICMACADEERKRKDYEAAREAERAAVKAGDRNFKGVGL